MSLPKIPFWKQILISLVLGLSLGISLNPESGIVSKESINPYLPWLKLPGDLFLNLLQMIMIPLVIVSIALGVSSLKNLKDLWNLGSKTLIYFIFTTIISVSIGITLTLVSKPGYQIQNKIQNQTTTDSIAINVSKDKQESIPEIITNIIPKNIINVWSKQQMLSIVFLGMMLGIFFLTSKESGTALKAFCHSLESFCLWVVSLAMKLAPLAVLGLMSYAMVQIGFSLVLGLITYILTVLVGLVLILIFYALMVFVFTKKNPIHFFDSIREIPILGFSTSSSSSVLPYSLKVAKEKLKLKETVADFVLPLGATINMDGTALYQAVATVFLSQVYQIELSSIDLFLLVGTVTAASIGTAATPGVGLVILSSILYTFHIPIEGITILFGVDRFLDMCRTSVNLTGDLSCAYIMDHIWKEEK
ncbi:dicarboxylate/amino acid:cation symporter [Leptospira levettii]|uniref:Dicarboxylate/amino acid:cation symporter n=1 Tax=Leptospira levettii TaxID=2023178 RepID=A0A5F2D8T8_9LEPT|nr:dicarboxylate/amino acid:cation symporter [Leptospira levettii]MCW7465482.1 dicarboxylate/amino acid:cation symporter [Leptospira levettii]MCW7510221.1 dicarboxylate/amino acid:cation symporter [Leptospira levettii]MCW7513973.1 dicarboxylate/amino acid:cation symporter [Leptospira levettii]TGM29607.1 dicarboxylate/amino acid:cation symporter [Leptospira levettii]TGM69201.1 dicarboxylate/amino acid:cation symporter [Leptospira levettii]